MAKQATSVEVYMAELEHALKPEIEALRKIVKQVDARLSESIKWNAPSYALADHFATFRLRPGDHLQLILHTGAKLKPEPTAMQIKDPDQLLAWQAPDRALISFTSMQEVEARRPALEAILKQWIAQL